MLLTTALLLLALCAWVLWAVREGKQRRADQARLEKTIAAYLNQPSWKDKQ